jgi:hypothetical protein
MRDPALPADVVEGKFKRDISFALCRGTIAQVTTALDAAQRAAEAELALNEAGWARQTTLSSLLHLPRRCPAQPPESIVAAEQMTRS